MRSAIACLLVLGLATGGCDRASPGNGQGSAAVADDNAVTPDTVTATAVAKQVAPGTIDRSHAGASAPDYPFSLADGTQKTLAAFKGKPVLVNLWATWCAPCIAEMPALDALAAREKGKINVLTISQDLEGAETVAPFFKKKGLTHLTQWLDPDLRFSTGFRVNLPTTILYDADGKEVWRVSGPMDWTDAKVIKFLSEVNK